MKIPGFLVKPTAGSQVKRSRYNELTLELAVVLDHKGYDTFYRMFRGSEQVWPNHFLKPSPGENYWPLSYSELPINMNTVEFKF